MKNNLTRSASLRDKLGIIFVLILFFASFFIWQKIFANEESRNNLLEVIFFDVGEGDSILVKAPESIQILIDGGPKRSVLEKIAKEMPFYDRKIELIILTHPDKDHITGLFEILDVFEVDKILMPKMIGKNEQKNLYVLFKNLIQERDIDLIFAKTGQKIIFPKGSFLIFWPKFGADFSDTNEFSVVSKVSFGEIDFLLTGDATEDVEGWLLEENFDLNSEILKVGHHGSKYSTSEEFIKEVFPEVAVISVGRNNYGHPAKEVLENLNKYDINIYRTDQSGNIKIISDGQSYKVSAE